MVRTDDVLTIAAPTVSEDPRDFGVPRTMWLRDSTLGLVAVAVVTSAVLQLLCWLGLTSSGGDVAAQDAWAEFARTYPDSAYSFSWYGGMHPINYSILSPYVMATIGVRPVMFVSSVVASGFLALIVARHWPRGWRRYVPTLLGVAAFFGNAASGRVTFALGSAFALAAVWLLLVMSDRAPGSRLYLAGWVGIAVLAALTTAGSPVSGLFLGIVAAALWLRRRRAAAYWLGLPPVAVVAGCALLFPFSGRQPMPWDSVILPVTMGLAVAALAPAAWRDLRVGALVYVVAVIAVWLVPSPIGTNVSRMGLLLGGVVLAAILIARERTTSPVAVRWGPKVAAVALAAGLIASGTWQVVLAAEDVVHSKPSAALEQGLAPVVQQLDAIGADLARVEVVPTRSHREAAAFVGHVALARGWNRQADVSRNPIFYQDDALNAGSYRNWLRRWAVRYVLLADTDPDPAAADEAKLVRGGLPYLREVWHNADWKIYRVLGSTPLITRPATVIQYQADELVVDVPSPGRYVVRVAYSPWITLVDAEGHELPSTDGTPAACLSPSLPGPPNAGPVQDGTRWVVLDVTTPGIYRLAAPYRVGGGASCPDPED